MSNGITSPLAIEAMRELVLEAVDACDPGELKQLVRMVRAFGRRREYLKRLGVTPPAPELRAGALRRDRDQVLRGLIELRDSQTWSPPQLTVIDGGDEH